MDSYIKLKGLYGNVVRFDKTKDKKYEPHAKAFWRELDKVKKFEGEAKAEMLLMKCQKHFDHRVERKISHSSLVSSLEKKQCFSWKRARYIAFLLFGNKCACCGVQAPEHHVTIDHIKPKSKFPELATDLRNLQPLCHDCNVAKCSWDMTDWRTNEQKFKAIHVMNFPNALKHYVKDINYEA